MTAQRNLVGLGTQLRHLLDLMDADVTSVLADLGLGDYRPRFSVYLRAVTILGPAPIRDLARATGVTHSAASQTIAEMARRGLVELRSGADGRQRIVHLTEQAQAIMPSVEAEWDATASAAAELDAELPFPLAELVPAIAAALDRRGFRDRILHSAWTRDHPSFAAALAGQPPPAVGQPGPPDRQPRPAAGQHRPA